MPVTVGVTTESWGPKGSGVSTKVFALHYPDSSGYNEAKRYTLPTAKWSTRGKHDPGDGPIYTRFVRGGGYVIDSDDAAYSGKEIVLSHHSDETYQDSWGMDVRRIVSWARNIYYEIIIMPSVYERKPYRFIVYVRYYGHTRYTSPRRNNQVWVAPYSQSTGYIYDSISDALADAKTVIAWATSYPSYLDTPWSGVAYGFTELTSWTIRKIEPHFSDQMFGFELLSETGLTTNRIESGMATAFLDAVEKTPNLSGVNMIANLKDLFTLLLGSADGVTKLGSLSDAWLGYRYAYSTTKADIEAVSDFILRLDDIYNGLRSNGYYNDGEWSYRCALHLDAPQLKEMRRISQKLTVSLSAYNIWDMIPYSFIVDWFLPIGSLIESWSAQKYAMPLEQSCWCSVRREFVNEYGHEEIDYLRIARVPRSLAAISRVSHGKVTTWLKRTLDALCIFAR